MTRAAGGRSKARAASAGGSAAAAAYGAAAGGTVPIPGIDLTAEQFAGLTPMQQADRIVRAAAPTGPREDGESPFHDDEIRRANGEFAHWVINQDVPAEPPALVRQWLVCYVWVVWQREVGHVLRQMDDPREMQRREQEMRVALEARVAGLDIPTTGVTPTDFQRVIQGCLDSLGRVFGNGAP